MYEVLSVAATDFPVSKDLVESHLKTDIVEESYFELLVEAITSSFETDMLRDLITKTYIIYLDDFDNLIYKPGYDIYYKSKDRTSSSILIKKNPVQSVEKVEYLVNDVWTEVSSDVYRLSFENIYPFIDVKEDQEWPSDADDVANNVRVTVKVGYGDTCEDIPRDIKLAILLTYASLDQSRGDCLNSASTSALDVYSNLPPEARRIIEKYKIIDMTL